MRSSEADMVQAIRSGVTLSDNGERRIVAAGGSGRRH